MTYSNNREEHSFKTFSDNIKNNDISDVILMCGTEDYLINWAVKSLVQKYINENSKQTDYVVFDQDITNINQIIDACNTFSILSSKKIVWVKNFTPIAKETSKGYTDGDIVALENYINSSNSSTILVLSVNEINKKINLVKKIVSAGQIYDFSKLEYGQLAAFANKRFRQAKIIAEPRIVKSIVEASGYYNKETDYRLYNFENDLVKMIAHSDGIKITEEDIKASINGDMETFVFNLLDAVSKNQKDNAFRLLNNILDSGGTFFPLLGLIISNFEIILEVREFRDDGLSLTEIIKKLKIHEFRVKKAAIFSEKFSREKLRNILSDLYEVDRNVKTGLLGQKMALEIVIARI